MFEKSEINSMRLCNRFVRSATWEGMAAEDGACTAKLTDLMTRLAQGGVGLIMTSHAFVRQDGQAGPWQLGIHKDELIDGLREMVRAVHGHGGRVVFQLAHAGFFAYAKLIGQAPLALSQVEGYGKSPRREMAVEDIQDITESFCLAARRAREAEADGVQIHAAHGYLLSQSLSPVFNRRDDAYGGSVKNRARFLLQVLRGVRAAVGPDFPVLIKMNCGDFLEGGLTFEDSLETGSMLAEGGIDAIELSGGTFVSGKLSPSRRGIKTEDKEAYFRDPAKAFKENLDVPIILVGGIRSFSLAERLVNEKVADYISMSRPLIREPDLINRWRSGDLRKAECVSDNQCFKPAEAGEGIYCLTERKQKEKGS